MPRKVFVSFDYARDLSRAARIRDLADYILKAPAGFRDDSVWIAAQCGGEDAVRALIDTALQVTTVTVVCIGSRTAGDRYVDYAIEQSILRGNGIFGVHVHAIPDSTGQVDAKGAVPALLIENWYKVYTYVDQASLAAWIEEAAGDAG